jgi:peroxiredoxin
VKGWIALGIVCVAIGAGCFGVRPQPEPEVVPAEPVRLPPDLDSLSNVFAAAADSLPPSELPALETRIQRWLARLEFEDPALLPEGETPGRYFRAYRGRLLDTLGWAAFRRQDMRQAEAALVSAVAEINSRGTTTGYAEHFLHLGRVYAARRLWNDAIDAFLDAEVRGVGERATLPLETVYRRRHGSLRGLDDLRSAERARIEDERQQLLVARPLRDPLPDFAYPRRTGPPLATGALIGRPLVLVLWDAACDGCPGYASHLGELATAMRRRGGALVGVWLGGDPAAAGPPQSFMIVVPPDRDRSRSDFGADVTPQVLVVDESGRIRYRWAGANAAPPPTDDILVQVDHLRTRAATIRSSSNRPQSGEAR